MIYDLPPPNTHYEYRIPEHKDYLEISKDISEILMLECDFDDKAMQDVISTLVYICAMNTKNPNKFMCKTVYKIIYLGCSMSCMDSEKGVN